MELHDVMNAKALYYDEPFEYHPHVTLARATESAAKSVSHWMHVHRDFAAPPFRVESFDLYASELRPSGAIHTLKERFPLTE